jgi:hypothetical protein
MDTKMVASWEYVVYTHPGPWESRSGYIFYQDITFARSLLWMVAEAIDLSAVHECGHGHRLTRLWRQNWLKTQNVGDWNSWGRRLNSLPPPPTLLSYIEKAVFSCQRIDFSNKKKTPHGHITAIYQQMRNFRQRWKYSVSRHQQRMAGRIEPQIRIRNSRNLFTIK